MNYPETGLSQGDLPQVDLRKARRQHLLLQGAIFRGAVREGASPQGTGLATSPDPTWRTPLVFPRRHWLLQ